MNFKGIDIHHLIYELRKGIRLPNPPFCPHGICDLISKCFYEDPNQRPNFKEIKRDFRAAYDDLLAIAQSKANTNGNETEPLYISLMPINEIKDDTMKRRYLNVKLGNKRHNFTKSFTQYDGRLRETNEGVSALKYISLEMIPKTYPMISDTNRKFSFDCQSKSASPLEGEYGDYKNWKPERKSYKPLRTETYQIKRFYSHPGEGNGAPTHSEVKQSWASF